MVLTRRRGMRRQQHKSDLDAHELALHNTDQTARDAGGFRTRCGGDMLNPLSKTHERSNP